MKRVIFIKNTAILTATSLILRFAGMIFKIWLSAKVGSEAIGLYQIIMSVYICISSFASSGISTAVTRLVTDELATSHGGIKKIVQKGVRLTLTAASICFIVMFFGSDLISKYFISDMRAALSIKILSISLVFVGLCSCFRGYFIARRKALGSSLSQITEQVVRITVTATLISFCPEINVTTATLCIVIGDVAAEVIASALLYIMYLLDIKGVSCAAPPSENITKKLLNISIPITSGRYLSTFLRTAESTAVPRLLVVGGMTTATALSGFGAIKGMALPLILFPSAVLSAVSLLLIPEISEAKAKNNQILLKSTVFAALKITTLISLIVGLIFWFCGEELGRLLYNDASVGTYIKWLAPLTPLMYTDSIADGMLKGLDKQSVTFRYSVADSGLRLLLIFLILPRFALNGFIFIMYLSNIFTAVLHFRMLIITSKLKIRYTDFLIVPTFVGLAVCFVLNSILNHLTLLPIIKILTFCVFSLLLYGFLLYTFGIIRKNEFN